MSLSWNEPHMGARGLLEETRRATVGRLSDAQSARRITSARYRAPEGLDGVVEVLWTGSWDLREQAPHHVRLLSDPSVNLVFEAGRSRIVGVWTDTWTRTLEGLGRVRAIKLHPGAAGILGPAAAFTGRMVPLGTVFEAPEALEARVLAAPTDDEALALVTRWLHERVRPPPGPPEAVSLLQALREESRVNRVDQVASWAGVSVRGLQRLFREQVGASPKWWLRRRRLQEAVSRLQEADASLPDLAYELGYADQAHFGRDFRAATGQAPGAFRKTLIQVR